MYLTDVIKQIRKKCPEFNNRVGGTAAFSDVTKDRQANLKTPSCFVVPIGEETIEERKDNQNYIYVREQFATIICVDNSKDRTSGRGMTASDAVKTCKNELLQSLLPWEVSDWNTESGKPVLAMDSSIPEKDRFIYEEMMQDLIPNSRASKMMFISGNHLSMTDARLWHQFVWETRYFIGVADDDTQRESLLNSASNFTSIMYSKYPEIGEVDVSFEPFYVDVLETGFNRDNLESGVD